jgi:type IV pilus assembly protein PilX
MQKEPTQKQQTGVALVTSLLLLLVLTIIGVTAMLVTRMQERMAGNTRDLNLAFQGAEAALRDGEAEIRALNSRPDTCSAPPCDYWQPDSAGLRAAIRDGVPAWWTANANEYATDGTADLNNLAEDPQYVTESLGFIPDSLTLGHGVPEGRDFYQVTARSTGGSGVANTVLQSTFTRRF